MTIDMHSHLFVREFYPQSLWDGYVRLNASWRPATTTLEAEEMRRNENEQLSLTDAN